MNKSYCPTCHQKISPTYQFHLDDTDINALRKLWLYVASTGRNMADVRTAGLTYTERSRTTQLRYHALIAKYKVNGSHKRSHWVITRRGFQFLKNEIEIPDTVIVRKVNGEHQYERTGRSVKVGNFHGNEFGANYQMLNDFDIVDEQLVRIRTISQPQLAL